MKITTAKEAIIANKIDEIMKSGIRRNTKRLVSKKNPRRKVPVKQAVAVANSIYDRSHRR